MTVTRSQLATSGQRPENGPESTSRPDKGSLFGGVVPQPTMIRYLRNSMEMSQQLRTARILAIFSRGTLRSFTPTTS